MRGHWMVRAGRGGKNIADFEQGYVAIGWNLLGNLTQYGSLEAMRKAIAHHWPDYSPTKLGGAASMVWKFYQIEEGDYIVSYNPKSREYLVGKDLGDYQFQTGIVGDYGQLRRVSWLGNVRRDDLPREALSSLNAVLTVFSIKPEVMTQLVNLLEDKPLTQQLSLTGF